MTARVMANRIYTLHRNDTDEPRATRVSILGLLWISPLKPLMKNFWLMTMMMPVSRSWTSPMATWLSSKNGGKGQSHIMCPIER